jgi:hypothetical protein
MTTVLGFDKQLNYDNKNHWSHWNMAAKRRILMDSSTTPTRAPYFVEQNMMGCSATHVSSLASTSRSNPATDPMTRTNPWDNAEPYGISSVIGPSMVTDRGESNCEMDEENINKYKYAEKMKQVNKTDVNLLDWIDADLESTGQAEIDDHWGKPRAFEMEGEMMSNKHREGG